jgi:hypothetical protein
MDHSQAESMINSAYHSRAVWALPLLGLGLGACGNDQGTTAPPGPAPNRAPVITSSPNLTAFHLAEWAYVVGVNDLDGDSVTVSVTAPPWLTWDASTRRLSGTAGWNRLAPFDVQVRAADAGDITTQAFTVDVELSDIDCNATYPDQATSPYILPFQVGQTYELWVGPCPSPPYTNHQFWFAWDFRMPMGDTVVAARAGTVTSVVERHPDGTRVSGQENIVYVRHADGSMGFYVHFMQNGVIVNVGDVVAQGQPIGLAGDSGGSAGPHLHFVVFRAGGFSRHYSLPVSFRNADGPRTARGALVLGADYTALP